MASNTWWIGLKEAFACSLRPRTSVVKAQLEGLNRINVYIIASARLQSAGKLSQCRNHASSVSCVWPQAQPQDTFPLPTSPVGNALCIQQLPFTPQPVAHQLPVEAPGGNQVILVTQGADLHGASRQLKIYGAAGACSGQAMDRAYGTGRQGCQAGGGCGREREGRFYPQYQRSPQLGVPGKTLGWFCMLSFRADGRLASLGQELPAKLVANVSTASAAASYTLLILKGCGAFLVGIQTLEQEPRQGSQV
eukprot:516691-Pelagomonas_calceolata.AAC.7